MQSPYRFAQEHAGGAQDGFLQDLYVTLQEGQRIIGDSHSHVVMLFSDIVGFSTMAMTMSPVEVFLLVRVCTVAILCLKACGC